mgnify:CR=1 FL=1
MIAVKNLYKSAKLKKLLARKKAILTDISFSVPEGKIVSIIGQNGAGKSTLIKAILGFTRPDSGTLHLDSRITLGYLPENPYYYDYLTLRELLWFSASSFGMSKADFEHASQSAATKVGMQAELNSRLRTFSKGMTQRAGIAAAIVHDPDLLILDEPMSGLDPVGRRMVFELMNELREQGKTILFCSHILSDVERLCDEVYIMHQGRIRRHLTREELALTQKNIELIVPYSDQTAALLAEQSFQAKRFADSLSVQADGGQLNALLDHLRNHNVPVEGMQSAAVSLEQVFNQIVAEGDVA